MKNPAEGQKSDGTELADYRSNLARSVRSMLDEFSRTRKTQVEMARNERRAALLDIRNKVTDIRNGTSRASEEEKVQVDDFFRSVVTGIQVGIDSAIIDEAPAAPAEPVEVQETPVSIESTTEAVQPEVPRKEDLPGEVFLSATSRKKTGSKNKQPKKK